MTGIRDDIQLVTQSSDGVDVVLRTDLRAGGHPVRHCIGYHQDAHVMFPASRCGADCKLVTLSPLGGANLAVTRHATSDDDLDSYSVAR